MKSRGISVLHSKHSPIQTNPKTFINASHKHIKAKFFQLQRIPTDNGCHDSILIATYFIIPNKEPISLAIHLNSELEHVPKEMKCIFAAFPSNFFQFRRPIRTNLEAKWRVSKPESF